MGSARHSPARAQLLNRWCRHKKPPIGLNKTAQAAQAHRPHGECPIRRRLLTLTLIEAPDMRAGRAIALAMRGVLEEP